MSALVLAALLALPAAAAMGNVRSEELLLDASLKLAAGDVAGALERARASASADPGSERAQQVLARAANAALRFEEAEQAATKGIALAGPSAALLNLRSEARAGRADFAGALADAEGAAALVPGSPEAALRRAIAEEGLGRPAGEVLALYERAAALDPGYEGWSREARARLSPPRPRAAGWGALIMLALLAAAAAGWGWTRRRGAKARRPAGKGGRAPRLPGDGKLAPRAAARSLAEAAPQARDPEGTLALAESLYERLTGRAPYGRRPSARELAQIVPASSLASGLPAGIDGFFARALDPDPRRRYRSGAELAGAFRSLVDPAVD